MYKTRSEPSEPSEPSEHLTSIRHEYDMLLCCLLMSMETFLRKRTEFEGIYIDRKNMIIIYCRHISISYAEITFKRKQINNKT